MWSEVTGKISLQEDLTNEGGYVCCCIVLCLCYYLYLLQNTENCITLSISTHIFENHSIIFAVACQMTKKKLFSALNFPRTSSGTMQRNNYLPRSNPRTKKGGTRFHICMLQGNASLILIPRRMLIRLPATSGCEQTGCAKIDAAMNLTKDTSLANHLSHFFLYFFLIFHC